MTVTGNRRNNDIRLELLEISIPKTQVCHYASRKIINNNVALLNQLFDDGNAFRFGEVELEALLALRPLVKNSGAIYAAFHSFGADRKTPGHIGPRLGLNLDDFGSKVSKMGGTEGTCPHPAKICYADTGEWESWGLEFRGWGLGRLRRRVGTQRCCIVLSEEWGRAADLPPWFVELIRWSQMR